MALRKHSDRRFGRSTTETHGDPSRAQIALMCVVFAAFLVAGIWFYLMATKSYVPTDPKTLCATDRPVSEIVVVLLDLSDKLSGPQRQRISSELIRLRDSMTPRGLLEVYLVDPTQRLPQRVFQICNPGTGADMSVWYQNPDLAKKTWEKFRTNFDRELLQLMERPSSDRSPIFEAIQSIALATFGLPKYDRVSSRRLFVVSDLMHYVPGKLNMYQGIPSFESFRKGPYFAEVKAELQGVTVKLLYLVRPQAPQRWPEHPAFWDAYFSAQGAVVEGLDPIAGAQ